eukprot:GHVN01028162.1.p1 GENE.GHVN01028162.1~~GHVN01028162.1.p1  ORF type:complete len:695 (-),score=125.63 GHVN01028162.1:246-2330(-)
MFEVWRSTLTLIIALTLSSVPHLAHSHDDPFCCIPKKYREEKTIISNELLFTGGCPVYKDAEAVCRQLADRVALPHTSMYPIPASKYPGDHKPHPHDSTHDMRHHKNDVIDDRLKPIEADKSFDYFAFFDPRGRDSAYLQSHPEENVNEMRRLSEIEGEEAVEVAEAVEVEAVDLEESGTVTAGIYDKYGFKKKQEKKTIGYNSPLTNHQYQLFIEQKTKIGDFSNDFHNHHIFKLDPNHLDPHTHSSSDNPNLVHTSLKTDYRQASCSAFGSDNYIKLPHTRAVIAAIGTGCCYNLVFGSEEEQDKTGVTILPFQSPDAQYTPVSPLFDPSTPFFSPLSHQHYHVRTTCINPAIGDPDGLAELFSYSLYTAGNADLINAAVSDTLLTSYTAVIGGDYKSISPYTFAFERTTGRGRFTGVGLWIGGEVNALGDPTTGALTVANGEAFAREDAAQRISTGSGVVTPQEQEEVIFSIEAQVCALSTSIQELPPNGVVYLDNSVADRQGALTLDCTDAQSTCVIELDGKRLSEAKFIDVIGESDQVIKVNVINSLTVFWLLNSELDVQGDDVSIVWNFISAINIILIGDGPFIGYIVAPRAKVVHVELVSSGGNNEQDIVGGVLIGKRDSHFTLVAGSITEATVFPTCPPVGCDVTLCGCLCPAQGSEFEKDGRIELFDSERGGKGSLIDDGYYHMK